MPTLHPASPASPRVGWIGTGVMGSSMCGNLLARGSLQAQGRGRNGTQALIHALAAVSDVDWEGR